MLFTNVVFTETADARKKKRKSPEDRTVWQTLLKKNLLKFPFLLWLLYLVGRHIQESTRLQERKEIEEEKSENSLQENVEKNK